MVENSCLKVLADALFEKMKSHADFFSPVKIVLPSMKMKDYLTSYWLKKYDGVLMNVEFQDIRSFLFSVLDRKYIYNQMSVVELEIYILKYLSCASKNKLPKEISDFIYKDDELDSIHLYDLCSNLASVFSKYEQDDFKMSSEQEEIYQSVMMDAEENYMSTLTYSYHHCSGIKKMNQDVYFFGFTYFEKIQDEIIEELKCNTFVEIFMLKSDASVHPSFTISACPSKLKEIEIVHSQICELLKNKENKLSDFLIVSNDISNYVPMIKRVFLQDDITYPSLPFVIFGKKNQISNITSALNVLIEIYHKGYFTRFDFSSLVNNPSVMRARDIDKEDIEAFVNSILKMNVFRNSISINDWEYAKKRLLLSKVVNINDHHQNVVRIGDKEYLPYASLDMNDDRIVEFIRIVDDIFALLSFLNENTLMRNDDFSLLENLLNRWFMKDDVNFEPGSEYRKVIHVLHLLSKAQLKEDTIEKDIILQFLIDSSNSSLDFSGTLFLNGISFVDFNTNFILSAKYVFMIGMGSKELPHQDIKNELDKRDYDISTYDKQRNAFLLTYENSISHCFISYLNRDLKKDTELFASSFLKLLVDKDIKEVQKVIDLDEKRNYSSLFTRKEFKDKNYFENLINEEVTEKKEIIPYQREKDKKVKLKDMVSFLEEPLKYKTLKLFGYSDDSDSKMRDEYEPFDLNSLDKSKVINKLVLFILRKNDVELKEYKYELEMKHILPLIDETIKENAFLSTRDTADKIVESCGDDYEIIKLEDLLINSDISSFVLTYDKEFVRSVNENVRNYFILKIEKEIRNINNKTYLESYVVSLMDIASLNDDKAYHVALQIANKDAEGKFIKVEFDMTSKKAKEILSKIYEDMNDYENNYFMPINFVNSKQETYDKYFGFHKSAWSYFDDKGMFDFYSSNFLSNDNFDSLYPEIKKKIMDMILYIREQEEEN